ncbi:hypothetical protein [Maribacter sp. 2304DJ31-5]|uniref:hypothetical protein n=1 Tax=Maribacter sp. 2304DJ31-5 TaxID=3386273 RepID=UPI0039BCC1B1
MEIRLIAKQYAKSLFIYGIMAGFTIVFWNYTGSGKISLEEKVFIVLAIWLTSSISSVYIQIESLKRIKNSKLLTKEDFKMCQTKLLKKSIPIENALQVLRSNKVTEKWNFKIIDSEIYGKSKMWIGLCGENLKIGFFVNQITIQSRPVLRTTIFDNGKNLRNVKAIKKILANISIED